MTMGRHGENVHINGGLRSDPALGGLAATSSPFTLP